jgi:hypothetical protein
LDRNHRQFADGYRPWQIFISAVKKDYFRIIKKTRATRGQPNCFGVYKPEDFPSGAIPMEKR